MFWMRNRQMPGFSFSLRNAKSSLPVLSCGQSGLCPGACFLFRGALQPFSIHLSSRTFFMYLVWVLWTAWICGGTLFIPCVTISAVIQILCYFSAHPLRLGLCPHCSGPLLSFLPGVFSRVHQLDSFYSYLNSSIFLPLYLICSEFHSELGFLVFLKRSDTAVFIILRSPTWAF